MNRKTVKAIDKYLEGFQEAAGISDAVFNNVRKNIKRIVQRSSSSLEDALMEEVDVNALIIKAGWTHG